MDRYRDLRKRATLRRWDAVGDCSMLFFGFVYPVSAWRNQLLPLLSGSSYFRWQVFSCVFLIVGKRSRFERVLPAGE